MSVRDNILFGRTMDSAFYHRVVCCSQLLNDFNKFPNSDLTEVGEKVRGKSLVLPSVLVSLADIVRMTWFRRIRAVWTENEGAAGRALY